MSAFETIRTKRAVRQFTDQPVPETLIRQILDAGRRAQSSRNSQPWRFIAVRDRDTLRQLSTLGPGTGHLAGAAFAVVIVSSVDWTFDVGQAAAYLQLAAWELGVGSCIAWIAEGERARSILGAPDGQHIEIALSFGYAAQPPNDKPKPGGRLSFDDVVRWEKW